MRIQALYIFVVGFVVIQAYGVISMKSSLAAGQGYGAWAFSIVYSGLIILYLLHLRRRALLA